MDHPGLKLITVSNFIKTSIGLQKVKTIDHTRKFDVGGFNRLSSGPYFSFFSYFSQLFWFAPTFPYFFLKMPYYPYFFILKSDLRVKSRNFSSLASLARI